ncbi:hypothetical protein [Sodalis ligni]|uniref:Uncharacterized protein n=1 Tax=Sodalis ligni TaxID=2697027 RepID=A0A4R1NE85_9GAMM|nr:hypothetical protein [Sodalis ligni]TCL05924.1 hypothetical protein EZJ58_4146 [Sodalis ligni]
MAGTTSATFKEYHISALRQAIERGERSDESGLILCGIAARKKHAQAVMSRNLNDEGYKT